MTAPNAELTVVPQELDPTSWLPAYPSSPDFRFDYHQLMERSPNGLAELGDKRLRIAIVGAGVAGLTAARELFRCGCNVTIYEASNRIGGRLYTQPNPRPRAVTDMELGAMRMPFFTEPGGKNCVLDYYLCTEPPQQGIDFILAPFPNPGKAAGGTGIYLNDGLGPDGTFAQPRLIAWPGGGEAEDPTIRTLTKRVNDFLNRFESWVKEHYRTEDWPRLWQDVIARYDSLSFEDLVTTDEAYDPKKTWFGGLGMSQSQSDLLYTIGIGDGSWGAFYQSSALWFLRCIPFGYSANLKTVVGFVRAKLGAALPAGPAFRGIQALPEYLHYVPPPGLNESMATSKRARLHLERSVRGVRRTESGKVQVTGADTEEEYDYAIVTSAQWASEMSLRFEGFGAAELPRSVIKARNVQHNISSCKLFFPLVERYWGPGKKVPQVITTDTFVKDVYGVAWGDDPGVILASYTWEDDSLKLLPYDRDKLARLVLEKLREITVSTTGEDITRCIDKDSPVMIQWILEPTYHGCAKLYRPYNWDENFAVMSYNQNYGGASRLFFAGENYSLEGGWTEPALRSALDAVIHLIKKETGSYPLDCAYPSWRSP